MSRLMGTSELARPGGLFDRLGSLVVRWPLAVIGFWIAFAAVLMLAFPLLPVEAAKHPLKPLPDDAPAVVAEKQMGKAFHEEGSAATLLVVLTDEKGLGSADEDVYRKLVDKLHQDTQDKMSIQDFLSVPAMREVLASKDGKAWTLPITLPGEPSTPEDQAAFKRIAAIIKQTVAGTTLTANLSGPLAIVADLNAVSDEDLNYVEIGTVLGVLIILLIIYRNLITIFVPLAVIGASVATAQGVLSGLSEIGLDVNTQTIVLMGAVMIGAGTDYAVFLLSRYHDYVRHGDDSDQAVQKALMSIGKVIAASAATVAVTFSAMAFSKLEVFSTVGPAISVSILVSFFAAVTFLPAILVLAGRRGWIKPRRDLTTRFWRRSGVRVVRRPRLHLAASLVVLITLAGCASLVRFNYNDLKSMPDSVDSSKGYDALTRHFPMNSMSPQVLLIQSPRDLRTPPLLADLEQMASRVSQLPDIKVVRGLTRPNGEPLEQTKLSFQAGEVGGKLNEASGQIQNHGGDLDRLVNGSNQLADALTHIRDQVGGAVTSLSGVVTALTTMQALMGGDKTITTLEQLSQLSGRMRGLGDRLDASTAYAENTAAWASPMVRALNASPECNADPDCVNSRAGLAALVAAQNDGSLASMRALAHNLQAAQQDQSIGATLDKVQQSLNQAVSVLKTIRGLQSTMGQMQQGSNALADGSRQVAGGVKELVDQTRRIGSGLDEASSFLLGMKHDAEKPSMGGFNIPPQFLTTDDFKKGAAIFISPDGHAARYLITSALDPFTIPAMDQANTIINTAKSAQPNTELSDAKVSLVGLPPGLRDTRDYYNDDIQFIVFTTIIIVFLILVVLLRAIVAPLYLIGSVLVSYLSALGIGVVVFQLILGEDLHWSLPGLSFILLVAVGADYNMLLISRIRDESPHGVRVGVIRTVGSTGGVITSAGLIFAASMFGLMTASISTLVEAGFIIGTGIVIDTFIVRTITVPAMAAIIGQKNWWPSHLGKSAAQVSAAQLAQQRQRARIWDQLVRLKLVPSQKTRIRLASPPATGLAPVRKVGASENREATAGPRPTKNGKPSTDQIYDHALPLFDLSGLADQPIPDLRGSTSDSLTTGKDNGQNKIDRYLGHSLPLFGPNILSHRPTTRTNGNGNGHANGNGDTNSNRNRKDPIEHDLNHSLPLFGPIVSSHPLSSGNAHAENGNGKHPVGHLEAVADKPEFT